MPDQIRSQLRAGPEAMALHQKAIVWDCMALDYVLNEPYAERMVEGGVSVANVSFAIEEDWEETLRNIENGLRKVEASRNLVLATCADDVLEAKRKSKLAVFIGTQGSTMVGKHLWRVQMLARLGVRSIGLCYSPANLYGDGCGELRDAGLTFLGRDFIAAVNEQSILLALSHCGHRTAREAVDLARAPVCTHANAYGHNPNDRNRKDELIQALTAKGGMIGVCCLPRAVKTKNPNLSDLLDHHDYIARLVGSQYLGLGLDFIEGYVEHKQILPESHRWHTLRPDLWGTVDDFYTQTYPLGLHSILLLPNFTQGLLDRKYSEEEVLGSLGANWLRTFRNFIG